MKIAHTLVGFAVLIGACALPMERESTLTQAQRENVGQRATSEFVTALQAQPPPPLDITIPTEQGDITIRQPVQATQSTQGAATISEESESKASGTAASSVSLPMSVALLIGGVALLLIIVAVVWILRLLKSSAAGRAALALAEKAAADAVGLASAAAHRGFSNLTETVNNRLAMEKDAEEQAALSQLKASIERERAIATKAPVVPLVGAKT